MSKYYADFIKEHIESMKGNPFKMNLQLFAEPAPDPAEPTQPDAGTQEPPQEPESQPRMFTQQELEAAITSRLNRYKRDEAKRIDAARDEGRSEAEKLAKMTEDQRIEHERQRAEQAARDRETALATREAEITRRELRAAAIDTLAQKGLPRGLEAILNYADADACNASIDAVEKVFREAVQEGVNERLRASGVPLRSGSNNDYSRMSDADYYAATYKPGKK